MDWDEEFHNAAMDYRAARVVQAPKAYEALLAVVDKKVALTEARLKISDDCCERLMSACTEAGCPDGVAMDGWIRDVVGAFTALAQSCGDAEQADEADNGECESCIDGKCRTGSRCVTLGWDGYHCGRCKDTGYLPDGNHCQWCALPPAKDSK